MNKWRITHTTPVLSSSNYPRSRRFYHEYLGLKIVEEGGDPAQFGIFEWLAEGEPIPKEPGPRLFINAWQGGPPEGQKGWQVYLHVVGIETFYESLLLRGIEPTRDLENTAYGMREFEITDPDGNVLCFGEG
jgi:catechol 2,3-dioxygenase-like lactoylglutathione lyase family enzyme